MYTFYSYIVQERESFVCLIFVADLNSEQHLNSQQGGPSIVTYPTSLVPNSALSAVTLFFVIKILVLGGIKV